VPDESAGTAGNFGKFTALPVAEVEAIFARCAEQADRRALSAVLRIAREQIEARGSLDSYVRATYFFGALAAGLGATALLWPAARGMFAGGAIGSGGAAAVLAYSAVRNKEYRREGRVAEARLETAARDAIETIARKSGASLGTIDWSQRLILDRLYRGQAMPEEVRELRRNTAR
jgi:hypothetical protein